MAGELSDKFKEKLYKWIEENYFDRNFGTVNKVDFETFLFGLYYDDLRESGGLPNYEHEIGKRLGLTDMKVRNFICRYDLKFHSAERENNWWYEIFCESMENAEILDGNKILIPIPDFLVINEIHSFAVSNNIFTDCKYAQNYVVFTVVSFVKMLSCMDNGQLEIDKTKIAEIFKTPGKQQEIFACMEEINKTTLGKFLDIAEKLGKDACKLLPCSSFASDLVQKGFGFIRKKIEQKME